MSLQDKPKIYVTLFKKSGICIPKYQPDFISTNDFPMRHTKWDLMFVDASRTNSSNLAGCKFVWYKANIVFEAARCWKTYADSIVDVEARSLISAMK